MAQALEHANGDFLVDGMVFGQQDAQAPLVRRVADRLAGSAILVAVRLSGLAPTGHDLHQGVEQLRLTNGLGQAGGDLEGGRQGRVVG